MKFHFHLKLYTIYRGLVQNFTPSIYSLLNTVTTNSYDDTEVLDYRYYYKISAYDISGNESEYSDEASFLVGVNDEDTSPTEFSLSQNYPNPFNPSTTINYSIPSNQNSLFGAAMGGFVTLKIYNILGMEIATLINKAQSAGNYNVTFDATKLSSGIYFYTLNSGAFSATKKLTILK
ncbi:MAG: T9SS type A sorting domain-containing protein [Melioribacteraceae bacterium]|jgi:hypothetical protein|nr:T9SS type A sorting domain-containing protein [Melioribacteraceae bacterium]